MADDPSLLGFSPKLDTAGIPPEAPPTPLQGLTGSLGLMPSFQEAGARRVEGLKASAARGREDLAGLKATAAEQETAAAKARPEPVTIGAPPSTEARPFLAPGKNVLDQLQTVMVGINQIALGVGGLKGGGHAIAAVAGLKGALEGWHAGDNERAAASLKDWKAASDRLLENHRQRREAYSDLLTEHKTVMDTRMREIGIQARINGDADLVNAAEQGNIGEVMTILGQREQQERQHQDKMETLRNSIAQHTEQAKRLDRAFEATERNRAAVTSRAEAAGARAERGLQVREAVAPAKLLKEDDGISNSLRNMSTLEESIRRLNEKGVIPKGATAADKFKARVALQTSFGDEQVAQDIENVRRLGTALLVGSEVAAGLSPSVARLKVIGEAEAAGADAIPKSFWDAWFVRQRQSLTERRATLRHALGASRAPAAEAPEPEYEVLGEQ